MEKMFERVIKQMIKSKKVNKALCLTLDEKGNIDMLNGENNFLIEIDRKEKIATIRRDRNYLVIEAVKFKDNGDFLWSNIFDTVKRKNIFKQEFKYAKGNLVRHTVYPKYETEPEYKEWDDYTYDCKNREIERNRNGQLYNKIKYDDINNTSVSKVKDFPNAKIEAKYDSFRNITNQIYSESNTIIESEYEYNEEYNLIKSITKVHNGPTCSMVISYDSKQLITSISSNVDGDKNIIVKYL